MLRGRQGWGLAGDTMTPSSKWKAQTANHVCRGGSSVRHGTCRHKRRSLDAYSFRPVTMSILVNGLVV
ncbi:hypothetical protein KCU99_g236, partial [Aureobasidium melanogenum]